MATPLAPEGEDAHSGR